MRDDALIEDAHFVEGPTKVGRGGALYSIGAAVIAVAALATVIVWAYRLGVRDANDVPVIKAMVADMRIAPADPGGLQVEHQDRRVYDLIADSPAAAAAPATLAAPPEELADEDKPMERLAPPPNVAEAPDALVVAPPQPAQPAPLPGGGARDLESLVREALAGPEPLSDGLVSPVPRLRPTLVAAAPTDSMVRPTAATAPAQPAIQLGAYQTADVALEMWRSLAARNGDLLAGRDPVVDPLVGTTRTLYGLRAIPFATMAEAQGLCAALKARDEDCLVTETR